MRFASVTPNERTLASFISVYWHMGGILNRQKLHKKISSDFFLRSDQFEDEERETAVKIMMGILRRWREKRSHRRDTRQMIIKNYFLM